MTTEILVHCYLFIYLFIYCFLGLHTWHMKVPRLGVESELQLPAYATATATQGLSCACDRHHSSRKCLILNPLNEARDQPATSWFLVGFVSTVPQWESSCTFFRQSCKYKVFHGIAHSRIFFKKIK